MARLDDWSTDCSDEYAPLKAAKQLRRGKRISEIELLYGKTAASAAVASNADEATSDPSRSPSKGKDKDDVVIPDLTKDFFESAFFRRFQVQRESTRPSKRGDTGIMASWLMSRTHSRSC